MEDFISTLLHYIFDLTSIWQGQKSWKKIVGFLGDLKTPKGHFEINLPLAIDDCLEVLDMKPSI